MPGTLFWLIFCAGAVALAMVSQSLPYNPGAHLVWGLAGSAFYLWRVKAAGTQIALKVAAFVAGSLIVLSLFIYAAFSRLHTL